MYEEINVYPTREEAESHANGYETVRQLGSGRYKVESWDDFRRNIRNEADFLNTGGWKSTDKAELMEDYKMDEIHIDIICEELAKLEAEQEED